MLARMISALRIGRAASLSLVTTWLLLAGNASAFAAAGIESHGLDGKGLSALWALPFAGLLLSIAIGPTLFHHFWEKHYGKIAAFWGVLTLLPLALSRGWVVAAEAMLHTIVLEYVSFIILLFALYTIAGGIFLSGRIRATALTNTAILALGAALASIIGTTGASMILIRPIIRANAGRGSIVHIIVFFILLVSNIGGALTPLGDPPLFLGFMRGVEFFWTTKALFKSTLLVSMILLGVFFLWDRALFRDAKRLVSARNDQEFDEDITIYGAQNIALLIAVIGVILGASAWKPGVNIPFPGGVIELQNLVRDIALLGLALVSLAITSKGIREGNEFGWGPILEVAKLFAAIFICMIPVLAMLKAGLSGPFAPLIDMVTLNDGAPNNTAYFWLTGVLSAFLDNAPTYLVFFELAGGDPMLLMGQLKQTLVAISIGAVFMGALTYIGNAPNLMVAVIARDMGVKMPGFFGYMLWSIGILGPLLVIVWLIEFF